MTIKSKAEKIKLVVAKTEFVEEDGWIFRERVGAPVECVRRAPETPELFSPYQSRHNYPST